MNSNNNKKYNGQRYNSSPRYNNSSFDELTMDSNMVAMEKTTSSQYHHSQMVSFGDLLEDEEREEGEQNEGRGRGEVRESVEISLGGNAR